MIIFALRTFVYVELFALIPVVHSPLHLARIAFGLELSFVGAYHILKLNSCVPLYTSQCTLRVALSTVLNNILFSFFGRKLI